MADETTGHNGSFSNGVDSAETVDMGLREQTPEKSAILSGSAAATLYTGEARAVEGAERPIIAIWKSVKRTVGLRITPEGQETTTRRAILALVVLFFVSVLNQADRWLLPVVAPDGMRCFLTGGTCKNDTVSNVSCGCVDFSTYDQGILTGPAFCSIYVLSGIPLSYLADTKSRSMVLAIGLTFWSIMVFATGFVKETWQLYLTRMGLGIGEVRRKCSLNTSKYYRRTARREAPASVCTHGCSAWRANTVLLTSKRCIHAYKPGPTPHATQLVYTVKARKLVPAQI